MVSGIDQGLRRHSYNSQRVSSPGTCYAAQYICPGGVNCGSYCCPTGATCASGYRCLVSSPTAPSCPSGRPSRAVWIHLLHHGSDLCEGNLPGLDDIAWRSPLPRRAIDQAPCQPARPRSVRQPARVATHVELDHPGGASGSRRPSPPRRSRIESCQPHSTGRLIFRSSALNRRSPCKLRKARRNLTELRRGERRAYARSSQSRARLRSPRQP